MSSVDEFRSINPVNGQIVFKNRCWSDDELLSVTDQVCKAAAQWGVCDITQRMASARNAANLLTDRRQQLAGLICSEMGKVISEAGGEIDKCIFACEYYADHAQQFLANENLVSDADVSYVCYQPLGTVLGIMPWNFPFWQVFRFAIPALLAGNTVLLKHASNVSQSALQAERLLHDAGFPKDVFRCVMIRSGQLKPLYRDNRIRGIAVTGSEKTGRTVAAEAGLYLKKVVLELGGSDAFLVLDDADIHQAVSAAVASRFFTSGQSCINAKRIIVMESVADKFLKRLSAEIKCLAFGNPLDPDTRVGPMAREDLRQRLHQQVSKSIAMGAEALLGCIMQQGPGFFYPPSLLTNVTGEMPVYREEVFGPVAVVITVKDQEQAIAVANDSDYGLGATVWTADIARGEQLALQLHAGTVYVNGVVKSDPRLPFGGIKNSGMGRELGRHGMLEFVNTKSVWLGIPHIGNSQA